MGTDSLSFFCGNSSAIALIPKHPLTRPRKSGREIVMLAANHAAGMEQPTKGKRNRHGMVARRIA
jgi:hypothetical protein